MVKTLREEKGWDRLTLASKAKVSPRTIIDVELEKRHVLLHTARQIAGALEATVECLTKRVVYPDDGPSEPDLPNVEERYRERLNRACDYDLAGNHDAAIALCRKLLAKIGNSDGEQQAIVLIRLATFLDNAGEHTEALKRLDHLKAETAPQQGISPHLLWWAAYHRAIALRRLGDLDAAEQELQRLLENKLGQAGKHSAAVKHQLGVIHFKRSRGQDGEALSRALEYFLESGKAWADEHNHREGFALRRVGQVYAIRQRFAEAIECFFDAMAIFSRCRCPRYAEETRKDLRRHIFSKVEFRRVKQP